MSVLPHGQLDLYTANDASNPQPMIIWVHGGGYVGSDKSCCAPWAHIMVAKLKAAVISINYCPAPEQHYPGPILQLLEALDFLNENREKFNLDMSRLFFAGDSAGAQIISQFAALVCNKDLQTAMKIKPSVSKMQLKGIILCCGFYNMDTVVKSKFPAIKTFLWAYTNVRKISNYSNKDQMSAVKYVEKDYCDTFITCGKGDPFIGQAQEMIAALSKTEINFEAFIPESKKSGHEYQFQIGTPEANEALKKAVEFIEKRI